MCCRVCCDRNKTSGCQDTRLFLLLLCWMSLVNGFMALGLCLFISSFPFGREENIQCWKKLEKGCRGLQKCHLKSTERTRAEMESKELAGISKAPQARRKGQRRR